MSSSSMIRGLVSATYAAAVDRRPGAAARGSETTGAGSMTAETTAGGAVRTGRNGVRNPLRVGLASTLRRPYDAAPWSDPPDGAVSSRREACSPVSPRSRSS